MAAQEKSSFFLRNLARGFVWLGIIVALFVFTKHNVNRDLFLRFEPFFDQTLLILFIFAVSEIVIGIIPPELFMIWSLRFGSSVTYIGYIILLAGISYLAGFIAYIFGRYLHNTKPYEYLRNKYLRRSEVLLHEYGLYLILVAALTPIPFSGVAMLVGAVHYPVRKYIYLSMGRFVKFAISGWVIWEANVLA